MLFTVITIIILAGAFLGLAFHRFRTTRAEARSTILYVEVFKKYLAWLALRTIQSARRASPQAWWNYVKSLPLWRLPGLEKGFFVCFYGSFAYLAASGFFFAVFIPRGLYGYPLIGHVMAGGLFAACLMIIVIFKGRDYVSAAKPMILSPTLLDPRKLGITADRVKLAAFWLFVMAGLFLTLSALLPMLPLLRTTGQKLMLEFHRYSALALLLAAMVFAGLELFESGRS